MNLNPLTNQRRNFEDHLLTTEEVAERLGVKPATVYAYVSRGLLTSRRNAEGKGSLFTKIDVDAFVAARKRTTTPHIQTGITLIKDGDLFYRGRDATVLARTAGYEAVANLLWTGDLEDIPFPVNSALLDLARRVTAPLPRTARLTDRLRVTVAAVAAADPLRFDTAPAAVVATGRQLLSTMVNALTPRTGIPVKPVPLAEALWYRLSAEPLTTRHTVAGHAFTPGVRTVEQSSAETAEQPGVETAEPAGMQTTEPADVEPAERAGTETAEPARTAKSARRRAAKPTKDDTIHDETAIRLSRVSAQIAAAGVIEPAEHPGLRALNAALILLADHDIAASTLAARVAASTRAHPYAVVSAGLAALDGPLHGAASALAYPLLKEAASLSDPVSTIADRLRSGVAIPGFGHPLYPDGDPRATTLFELLADGPIKRTALRLADAMRTRSGIFPNVDLALAALTLTHGMSADAGEAIFAVARTSGWLAHALEEYSDRPSRFRPNGRYSGPQPA